MFVDTTTTNVNLNRCPHCGNIHSGQCSRVKAIEYYPDGRVKRVEYHDIHVMRESVINPDPFSPPYDITCHVWTGVKPLRITYGNPIMKEWNTPEEDAAWGSLS